MHSSYPYPNDEEKECLAAETGLTARQISSWFVNARCRRSTSQSRCSPSTSAPALGAWKPPPGEDLDNGTPLDRWRHTPPDQECTSLTAIARALEASVSASSEPSLSYYEPRAEALPSGPNLRYLLLAHAVMPFPGPEVTLQPTPEAHHPPQAPTVTAGFGNGAGVEAHKLPTRASSGERARRQFQCTFCTDTFKNRYDWTRHEGTLHLVLASWTCLPSGPTYNRPGESAWRCALCDFVNPSKPRLQ